jgi:ABC-type sulfate transport system permease subunit
MTLGASGWKMFWRVTLPNLKWALLYGVIQANARAMGEFGAVSVVSGHIRGVTNTLRPCRIRCHTVRLIVGPLAAFFAAPCSQRIAKSFGAI